MNLKTRIWPLTVLYFCALSGAAAAPDLPGFAKLIEKYGAVVVHISAAGPQGRSWKEGRLERGNVGYAVSGRQSVHDNILQESTKPGIVASSLGSGFIISEDGYILTSAHVVKHAAEITVKLKDRREFVARVVGSDQRSDVALIKINAGRLRKAVFGDPAKLKVGDWVLAIGSPFGFEYSASSGIVSATGRNLPNEHYIPFIQTDAAINPGTRVDRCSTSRGKWSGSTRKSSAAPVDSWACRLRCPSIWHYTSVSSSKRTVM